MLESKERRTKVKNVEMSMVKKLLLWRKKRNDELKGTGCICDLRPRVSKPQCSSCGYFKSCHHYEWEREYIYKNIDSDKDSKMRKKKQGKNEQNQEVLMSHLS